VNSVESISKKNHLPGLFLQTAQLLFQDTTLNGVMLETSELHLQLVNDELNKQWLSNEELRRFSTFKLDKRRKEWLGGRICAKLAAGQISDIQVQHQFSRIVVINAPGGRPSIQINGHDRSRSFDVSISHSSNFAIAILATDFCGIDIQETTETLLRVKERFCSLDDEKILNTFLQAHAEATRLNYLWTAKEAIRKALSYHEVPEFLRLKLFKIEILQENLFSLHFSYKDQTVKTICGPYRNYCLSLCVQKGLADA
jgi:phosphopantetheinyl transferase